MHNGADNHHDVLGNV